jgi:catechol 2,3-dioxygenase-like lactoylglutathione lyase family enzyme
LEGSANVTGFEYDRQLVISVGVSDFDSALAWYRDNLGFELVYKLDEYGWGEVKTPFGEDVTIGIGQTEEVRPGSTVPTFGVKDIDAARTALEANGVVVDDTSEVPGKVKLATFYDPDGNPWMFAQALDNRDRSA